MKRSRGENESKAIHGDYSTEAWASLAFWDGVQECDVQGVGSLLRLGSLFLKETRQSQKTPDPFDGFYELARTAVDG